MINLGDIYIRIENDNLSREEMLEIAKTIDKQTSFEHSVFTPSDVYILMAETGKLTPADIKVLYNSQVNNFNVNPKEMGALLDQGTKALFDEIWDSSGDKFGAWNYLYKCKFTDSNQLEQLWTSRSNKTHTKSKQWLDELKKSILSHTNSPVKLQNRNLRDKESLIQIAKSSNIGKKALEAISSYAQHEINVIYDELIITLLNNDSLDWVTIANTINLKKHLDTMSTDSILNVSKKRQIAIFKFCKKPNASDKAKLILYNITKDTSFLPQTAKDIFLF